MRPRLRLEGRSEWPHNSMRLESRGWRYDDGLDGPPTHGRVISGCHPYPTIVGAHELGYEDKRPPYKRAKEGHEGRRGLAAAHRGL
jgi:hypothetical protein